jgi:hypothetical protein
LGFRVRGGGVVPVLGIVEELVGEGGTLGFRV